MTKIDGLRIDWHSGEGKVNLPTRFLKRDGLFRADVLKDWLIDLSVLYEEAVAEWAQELRDKKINAHR